MDLFEIMEKNENIKKDRIERIETNNVTSFDEMYTDFNLWIVKYVNRWKQRKEKSQEDDNTQDFDCSWQHLFVQGFFVRKRNTDRRTKRLFYNNECEDMDSVILGLINKNGQIFIQVKSKL